MKFSIIVPVYKTEDYICQCIDSILNQTFQDFEVILVNDGSPDNCPLICDGYAKKDNRIKVIHKKNGGLVSARISGTEIAQGDYILNVDSDDYISLTLLEKVAKAIDETKVDVVYFGYCRFNRFKKTNFSISLDKNLFLEKDLQELYPHILSDVKSSKVFTFGIEPPVCFKAIRKNLMKRHQLSVDASISLGEDLAVTLPLMLDAKSMYVIDEPLYYYRTNETSITQGFNKNYSIQAYHLIKYLEKQIDLSKYDLQEQLCEFIIHLIFDIAMSNAKHFNKYKEYIDECRKVDNYLINKIKLYKSRKSIKHRIITFLIKNRLYFIFWMFTKIKGKNKNG